VRKGKMLDKKGRRGREEQQDRELLRARSLRGEKLDQKKLSTLYKPF
jgi:hypothetical protein